MKNKNKKLRKNKKNKILKEYCLGLRCRRAANCWHSCAQLHVACTTVVPGLILNTRASAPAAAFAFRRFMPSFHLTYSQTFVFFFLRFFFSQFKLPLLITQPLRIYSQLLTWCLRKYISFESLGFIRLALDQRRWALLPLSLSLFFSTFFLLISLIYICIVAFISLFFLLYSLYTLLPFRIFSFFLFRIIFFSYKRFFFFFRHPRAFFHQLSEVELLYTHHWW